MMNLGLQEAEFEIDPAFENFWTNRTDVNQLTIEPDESNNWSFG